LSPLNHYLREKNFGKELYYRIFFYGMWRALSIEITENWSKVMNSDQKSGLVHIIGEEIEQN
jgi:hypothetical protein